MRYLDTLFDSYVHMMHVYNHMHSLFADVAVDCASQEVIQGPQRVLRIITSPQSPYTTHHDAPESPESPCASS